MTARLLSRGRRAKRLPRLPPPQLSSPSALYPQASPRKLGRLFDLRQHAQQVERTSAIAGEVERHVGEADLLAGGHNRVAQLECGR